MASCKPGKTRAKETVSRGYCATTSGCYKEVQPKLRKLKSPSTPTINIHLKLDSSTLLERKSNKLRTFSSFQESLHASKKSSAANLKDKAVARAAALAVACDLKRNNKISSGRGLSIVAITSSQRRSKHDMEHVMRWNVSEAMGIAWMESFARNMQLSEVDRRARFDFIAQHRRCTGFAILNEYATVLDHNSVLALEALSSLLVNEDDDQDAFVNVDFNIYEMWLHEDIQTRPSAITEQQWTFHITKFRISLLINTDGMVR
ncbi:hypothetical protein Tco_0150610 [Tanacetum coccineum]